MSEKVYSIEEIKKILEDKPVYQREILNFAIFDNNGNILTISC